MMPHTDGCSSVAAGKVTLPGKPPVPTIRPLVSLLAKLHTDLAELPSLARGDARGFWRVQDVALHSLVLSLSVTVRWCRGPQQVNPASFSCLA